MTSVDCDLGNVEEGSSAKCQEFRIWGQCEHVRTLTRRGSSFSVLFGRGLISWSQELMATLDNLALSQTVTGSVAVLRAAFA